MSFLFSSFDNPFAKREISRITLPVSISTNLRPSFAIRPYQEEAFKRFVYTFTEDFEGKPKKPLHLLFNMATGSGKTFIMAGLILYLYEQGYRNFLFFVPSNTIIRKTKDNFLNRYTSKYLFGGNIIIDGKEVLVKDVEAFDSADANNINIKFTTIQLLHSDLISEKENGITAEDLSNHKIVLIGDEGHHLSAATRKGGDLFGWERTALNILNANLENILLEFTATLDYENADIIRKYQEKVIFRYDLAAFRKDGFSKEINLVRSEYEQRDRVLQALILNLYRQELATINYIDLKPVILFKSKRIMESAHNKEDFHTLIESLSAEMLEHIRSTSTIPVVQKAFRFFDLQQMDTSAIAKQLRAHFKPENCISANNEKELEDTQLKLNTLEDPQNPVRAVFAVQKLNEGWDVLNLFDIVRLYEGQNSGGSTKKVSATTLSEAQLIGRGARYFPFALNEGDDKFTRKYDNDLSNDVKILEELYYHTREDSRYISDLKKALIESGLYEDQDKLITRHLRLKPDFRKTEFYKTGKVVFNRRIIKSYKNVHSFEDIGVFRRNFSYTLASGSGRESVVFSAEPEVKESYSATDIPLSEFPKNVLRYALSQNPFFHFANLREQIHCFPNLSSLTEFMTSEKYLGGLAVSFIGPAIRLDSLTHNDFLGALRGLLSEIEKQIRIDLSEYEGSDYLFDYVHKVFTDKEIRVSRDDERADGQESVVEDKDWYAYNANYGTSEEKDFVSVFSKRFSSIGHRFKDIYLLRNERRLKIVDSNGNSFEPDFVLFCREKDGEQLVYQVFIEPKGAHLAAHDKWKEDFLKELQTEKQTITIQTDNYIITGVPFYNSALENAFMKELNSVLEL